MIFQDLKLKANEIAKCRAGYPRKAFVEVVCIKDFADNELDKIIDNATDFIKVLNSSDGLLTSHLISDGWYK